MKTIFDRAGAVAVKKIKREFDAKGMVSTGASRRSVIYTADAKGLSIYWPPHIWALINGRPPGKRPPFGEILGWVRRKLKPPEKDEWFIADRICQKIAQYGTRIYRGEAKGLEVDVIITAAAKMVRAEATAGYKSKVHNKIGKLWH